jgi:hypothetical protein
VLSELTDATNEGKGFSVFGIAYGLGSIGEFSIRHLVPMNSKCILRLVGPMLGGLLSSPATKYPSVFGGFAFLQEYPYFLPCFISSWVSAIGFVVGYFWLEESLQKEQPQPVDERTSLLNSSAESQRPNPKAHRTFKETMQLVFSGPVISAILPYNVLCFLQVIFDEVIALWAVITPQDGGLSFTSTEIGWSLSYMGILNLFVQVLFFPPIQARYGNVACYRWGMMGWVLTFICLPNVSHFAREAQAGRTTHFWVWFWLLAVFTIRVISAVFAFTSAMLFVSTAGRRLKALGLLNGVGQCGAGLARAIGPALGGTLWSWSLLNGLPNPFDYHFVFYMLVILGLLAFSQTFSLARYMERFEGHFEQRLDETEVDI